jgi:hypothetical protein
MRQVLLRLRTKFLAALWIAEVVGDAGVLGTAAFRGRGIDRHLADRVFYQSDIDRGMSGVTGSVSVVRVVHWLRSARRRELSL